MDRTNVHSERDRAHLLKYEMPSTDAKCHYYNAEYALFGWLLPIHLITTLECFLQQVNRK